MFCCPNIASQLFLSTNFRQIIKKKDNSKPISFPIKFLWQQFWYVITGALTVRLDIENYYLIEFEMSFLGFLSKERALSFINQLFYFLKGEGLLKI